MDRQCRAALLVLAALLGPLAPAQAHRPSDAYLNLAVSGSTIKGSWEIALRDLELLVGLDSDQDQAITWGELKAQHAVIAAHALASLRIATQGGPCDTRADDHLVAQHGDGAYAVLRFTADCGRPIEALVLGYDLLFDLDPLHRGLMQVTAGERVHSEIFSPERRSWRLDVATPDLWRQFRSYVVEGTWHIWIGFDHILFLLSLLLAAVQRLENDGWKPRASLHEGFVEVVKIVTVFTIAHSITLCLATLGWLDLPSRVVEPVIAATIVAAALNNVFPLVRRHLWAIAFGFGLIHGVGFAGALQDLGLPPDALLLSLFSFNLGVELGQLAIVAVVLPATILAARTMLYPRLVLRPGSLLIAGVASAWLLERSLAVGLPI